jgi:hypothetical protein
VPPTLTAPDPAVFPEDVRRFAADRGVTEYLVPLYDLAKQCFPGADVAVHLERDYEIAGLGWVVYVAAARNWDRDRSRAAKDRWRKAVVAMLPPDARQPFGLDVR